MCNRSKFIVKTLHRVQIASILRIASVPEPGDCRWVTREEVQELYEGLGLDKEQERVRGRGRDRRHDRGEDRTDLDGDVDLDKRNDARTTLDGAEEEEDRG